MRCAASDVARSTLHPHEGAHIQAPRATGKISGLADLKMRVET
jgi:hypothetical protein